MKPCLHVFGCGRQSGEIQSQAAQEYAWIGSAAGLQAFTFESGPDEGVDRVGLFVCCGQAGFDEWGKGPVFAPVGTLLDPGFESLNLGGVESFVCLGRRHEVVDICGDHSLVKQTLIGGSSNDGCPVFSIRLGGFFEIKAQICFAMLLVGSVAIEAAVGEEGEDLAVELDGGRAVAAGEWTTVDRKTKRRTSCARQCLRSVMLMIRCWRLTWERARGEPVRILLKRLPKSVENGAMNHLPDWILFPQIPR